MSRQAPREQVAALIAIETLEPPRNAETLAVITRWVADQLTD